MSRQVKLSSYYRKIGGDSYLSMDSTRKKKQSLSLTSLTPTKIPKLESSCENSEIVINLCSDDEDVISPNHNNSYISQALDASLSDTTVLYSPPIAGQIPRTPTSRDCNLQSPGSKRTFFSPTKNRKITSATKAKKNLNKILNANSESTKAENIFISTCKGLDDKTIFLLKIINKYLNNNSVRCLLPESYGNILSQFMDVMKPGKRLVCRLYWRHKGWYRYNDIRKIASGDQKDFDDTNFILMINSLIQTGLIESSLKESGNAMTFDDFVALLKINEIKEICKEFKIKMQTKAEGINSLRYYCSKKSNISNYFKGPKSNNATRVLDMLRLKTGPCCRLTDTAHIILNMLHYLMYFGMDYSVIRENKLELLLIYDKAKIETYPIDKDVPLDNASVVFNDREEFERYIAAYSMLEKWESITGSTEKYQITNQVYNLYKDISDIDMNRYKSLPLWLRKFTPAYLYVKVLEASVQELKKGKNEKYIILAVDILDMLIYQSAFRQHKKAEWYAEKALILYKLMEQHEKAADVLLAGLKSDISEEVKDAMRPRALKLASLGCINLSKEVKEELLLLASKESILEKNFSAKHIYKQPMESVNNRGKIKFKTFTPAGECMVQQIEEFCISQYIDSKQYTHGGHWEGKIVTTIFFLLFWDIIYMSLPGIRGIFLTHYQVYPQDLFCESFYVNRKTLIDERLKKIEQSREDEFLSTMQQIWDGRPECELSGICRSIGWEYVSSISTCLGARGLSAICRRLALDYRYAHSGFPDVTLWNIHTKQIKFVEVKSDSDKPSIKQIQWMHYLKQHGVQTEFCYIGVNTMRSKARARRSETDDFI